MTYILQLKPKKNQKTKTKSFSDAREKFIESIFHN